VSEGFAVDGVFCISLSDRHDRRDILQASLFQHFPGAEFLIVQRDLGDPQRGCFNSHQQCARMLVERGWQRALILEDDVMFYEIEPAHVRKINRYLTHYDPPIFYLGLILGRLWPTWSRGVVGCRALGTHAYILNRSAASFVMAQPYSGQGIDTMLKRCLPGRAAYPMLCQQQPDGLGKSDIDGERDGSVAKCDEFWRRNLKRQRIEWHKNLWRLLIPAVWK